MLREITNAKQAQDEPKKRWFSGLNMDLFVWFNDDEEIISYHLTYNKPHDEKALTWSKEKGFLYLDVDDGRRPGKHPGSPLLVQDGAIQPKKIVTMLKENETELESSTMNFIVSGIEEVCIKMSPKESAEETTANKRMPDLNIRIVNEQDLDRCFEIESVSYSGDEAATKDKILKRINTYPEGFIVLENDREIIGFINSGATQKVELSDEEFKELIGHDPEGKHIVILSVVIHPRYQGKGMASKLMKSFIEKMKLLEKTDIYLICQTELIDMYARYGFVDLGKSNSDHGGMSWNEMALSLQDG